MMKKMRSPVRKRRQVLLQLVRRPAGGNEMNVVEIKTPVRGARNRQMAGVDGVKRTAEQCDASRMVFRRRTLR